MVRLSAGREMMNEQMQALCFLAGANSIFYGERLLTTANPTASKDQQLFEKLGLVPMPHEDFSDEVYQAVITDELNEQQQPRYYQVS
jgi:biotin synthase